MKILIGNNGGVDFDAPIKVNKDQKDKIIKFLKEMFRVVTIEKSSFFRSERLGDKFFMRRWTDDELAVLLEIENTERVAEMLGRSWMSVKIKRGYFIPYFLSWTQENRKDILKNDLKELIREFMRDKKEEVILRREHRKKKRKLEKEIEKLKEERDSWDSEKRRKMVELAITLGQLKNEDLEEYITKKKKEISNKISQLESNLSKYGVI